MKLISLRLKNFKGAKDRELVLNGSDATICARNGLGKTTYADGFAWLLTGRDSLNQTESGGLDIKPKVNGEVQHYLDCEVEGEFLLVGGERLVLRRVYREVYEKHRGAATETFSRHELDYYVNGVPVKKADYVARIAKLGPELTLLTNPMAFNTVLTWKERRDLLQRLFGTVSDAEIIAANPQLSELPGILGSRSHEEHEKVVRKRQEEINKALDKLPARIDEQNRSLGSSMNAVDHSAELAAAREKLSALQTRRAEAAVGGELSRRQIELRTIEGELIGIENDLRASAGTARSEALAEVRKADEEIEIRKSQVRQMKRTLEECQEELVRHQQTRKTLLAELAAIKARTFDALNCTACGRPLPDEDQETAKANFNERLAGDLARNMEQGKALKLTIEATEAKIAQQSRLIEIEAHEINQVITARNGVVVPEEKALNLDQDARYRAKLEAKRAVEEAIASLRSGSQTVTAEIDQAIAAAQTEVENFESKQALLARRVDTETRIAQLATEQKALSAEWEKLEAELFLVEKFVRARSAILSASLEPHFKLAKFCFFEEQVNGGVKESCYASDPASGAKYESTNGAMRYNVGLDIINAIANRLGFAPPIFIDGAESVNDVLATVGQQIRLVVTPSDYELRVVLDSPTPAAEEPAQKELINA